MGGAKKLPGVLDYPSLPRRHALLSAYGLCRSQDVGGDRPGPGLSASTFLQPCLSPAEVWPSASSLQPPSSSSSSPLSWWVAMCRRWCAGAGRAESCTRWVWACSSSEGAKKVSQKEVGARGAGRRDGQEEGDEMQGDRHRETPMNPKSLCTPQVPTRTPGDGTHILF